MKDPTDDFNDSESRWVEAFRQRDEIDRFIDGLKQFGGATTAEQDMSSHGELGK